MPNSRSFLDRVRQSRMRRYWTRKLDAGAVTSDLRKDARKLRRILDEIERSGDGMTEAQSNPKAGLPSATLWANRPEPWSSPIKSTGPTPLSTASKIGADTTLYHDGKSGEVLAIQSTSSIGGPFELSLDIADFDGDYLSLALALPSDQIAKVQRDDLIRLDLSFSSTVPINALARANIKVGPNVEAVTRGVDKTRAKPFVEFDLFYVELDTQKITDVWVDLIFEKPRTNVVTIHDLRLSRRPRAKT